MSDSIVRDIMPYIIYNSLMTDIGPFCILILNAKIPVLERKGGGGGSGALRWRPLRLCASGRSGRRIFSTPGCPYFEAATASGGGSHSA